MTQDVSMSHHITDIAPPDDQDHLEQRARRLRALVEDGLASGAPKADMPEDWAELAAIADGQAIAGSS